MTRLKHLKEIKLQQDSAGTNPGCAV